MGNKAMGAPAALFNPYQESCLFHHGLGIAIGFYLEILPSRYSVSAVLLFYPEVKHHYILFLPIKYCPYHPQTPTPVTVYLP